MTYEELINKVSTIIQDDYFTHPIIGTYINQAQAEIAGGMPSTLGSWQTPPLPQLFTIDTVTTDTSVAYVNMPTTFQRSLQFAAAASGYEINLAESFISFSETYPLLNQSGRLSEVIEFGGKLYYQGIPTSEEEITLHFYRAPVDMQDDTDTPDGIPTHLHHSLLVNHAAWKIFDLIEDDFSEPGLNTQRYYNMFLQALGLLELSIPYQTRGMKLQ